MLNYYNLNISSVNISIFQVLNYISVFQVLNYTSIFQVIAPFRSIAECLIILLNIPISYCWRGGRQRGEEYLWSGCCVAGELYEIGTIATGIEPPPLSYPFPSTLSVLAPFPRPDPVFNADIPTFFPLVVRAQDLVV